MRGLEELVLRGLEPLPQGVVDVLGGAARRLPLRQHVAERGRGGAPVGGVGQLLGAFAQRLLGLAGADAFAVQLGEVRAAAPVERLARRGVALPQRVVGLAVQARDGAPLVEDLAQPVAGGLPLRRVGGDVLGLGGEGLLARGLRGAVFVALLALLGGMGVGLLDDGAQPGGQRVDVAEDRARSAGSRPARRRRT